MQTQRRRDILLAMVPYSPWRGEGVRRFAREAGWNLLEWSSLPGGIGGWRGDGALVTLRNDPELAALVRRLRRRGVPVVDMTAEHPEIRIPRVCLDSRVIGRMAAEHFAERNFRHAAWFSTHWTHTHAVRFASFAETWACGIAVPEEVAILCTGDDQMPCENQAVPLSCIIVGGERQGYEAAALLDRLIDGEEPPKEAVTVPPGGIAVRASTDRIAASNPVVAKALALIAENLARPWGVAQLCAALGVEPRTLHRRFVEELGRSPSREILRQRLSKARKLLGDTDMTLAEIAAQCGLCHASYLSNLFRRETGLSPRVWRRSRES